MASNTIVQRAREFGNPVIQDDRVVFVWEGNSAPRLISDLTDWDEHPKAFKRLTSTLKPATAKTIWTCSLTVPRDAYIEYAFYDPVTHTSIFLTRGIHGQSTTAWADAITSFTCPRRCPRRSLCTGPTCGPGL